MAVVLVIVAVAAVFAIAAVVVGREARRLAVQSPRPTFDFDEAVEWVCRHVTDDVAAILSPDDVRTILNWHLEYFRMKGVSTNGSSASHEGHVVVGRAATVESMVASGP